jgi:ribosomal protein S18 acetylase RimI-like enzyme
MVRRVGFDPLNNHGHAIVSRFSIMLEFTVRGWRDADLDEVASLTFNSLQDSPFFSPGRTLDDVEGWLNWNYERFPPAAVFQAYIGEELVGWLAVTVDVKPGISETWRWAPYISPEAGEREDGIATGLIRRCIEHVRERGQTRLEACFDRISGATMPHYERYRAWFEAEGVRRVDDSAYMRRSLDPGEFAEHDVALPPGYRYMPLADADEEALYGCYSRAFIDSGVRMYHDMTEEERRADFEHYFGGRTRDEEASLVVVRDDEIVGFSLVHSRPGEAHLADIGIVPAHRGKGLGRRMVRCSLMKAARDHYTVTLAVDVDNASAYGLYCDLGFEVEYRIITHAWRQG